MNKLFIEPVMYFKCPVCHSNSLHNKIYEFSQNENSFKVCVELPVRALKSFQF